MRLSFPVCCMPFFFLRRRFVRQTNVCWVSCITGRWCTAVVFRHEEENNVFRMERRLPIRREYREYRNIPQHPLRYPPPLEGASVLGCATAESDSMQEGEGSAGSRRGCSEIAHLLRGCGIGVWYLLRCNDFFAFDRCAAGGGDIHRQVRFVRIMLLVS